MSLLPFVGPGTPELQIVLIYKWETPLAASLVAREKLSAVGGIPFHVMEIVEYYSKSHAGTSDTAIAQELLESVSYGGGPANAELGKSIISTLKNAMPGQGYGATETSSMAAGFAGEDFLLRTFKSVLVLLTQKM